MNKLRFYLTHPWFIFNKIITINPKWIKDDELYLRLIFPMNLGKQLNLNHPKTYSEKLQWLKLYNRRTEYTQMVDKYEAKLYVSKLIGDDYIIPTYAVYDSVDDIRLEDLPDQFVLKTTHDSGGIVICRDKSEFDMIKAKNKLKKCLQQDNYIVTREWPYKNVPHRIICEKYMVDESGYELKDYKFFCFDGEPKLMFIASDRMKPNEDVKFDYYDMNFNHLPIIQWHPNSNNVLKKPKGFEEMKRIAAILSKGIPHLRVDLYDINGSVYFGELTFFHFSGLVPFVPEKWDTILGDWLKLPEHKE